MRSPFIFASLDDIHSPFPLPKATPPPPPPRRSARTTLPTLRGDDRIGSVVAGRYRIEARLAIGGMGIVYRAARIGLDRPVAVKFLRSHAVHDADAMARFRIEAKAASRLSHPNCVDVIDGGLDGDVPFIVMDLIAGQTLRQVMDAGPIAVPRALALIEQILAGLGHAHARGVIHRDIKPDNILIWSDGTREHAMITDFGLAKCVESLGMSQDVLIGTPNYMSPEQTLGLPVDARADVYACGVLLFELLTEQKPFRAPQIFETMRLHREAPVPHFEDIAAEREIPPEIEGVVRSALAKSPDARPRTAQHLARQLEEAMASAREHTNESDVGALLRQSSSRWRVRAMLCVLLAAAIALAALTYA